MYIRNTTQLGRRLLVLADGVAPWKPVCGDSTFILFLLRGGIEYLYEEWPKAATINNGHPDSCREDNSQRTTDRE